VQINGVISHLEYVRCKTHDLQTDNNVGLESDPGVQAVTPQVTISHPPGGSSSIVK